LFLMLNKITKKKKKTKSRTLRDEADVFFYLGA